VSDVDAEQEVDLGRYWNAIVARWWLPVLGLLVGAVIGYLVSLGGGQVWRADATVYLGASYSIVGGTLLQGPQANPSTVATIVHSEEAVDRAAAKARMAAKDIRGKISTKTISTGLGTGAARPAVSPLVRVRVESSTRRRARLAANDLAATVVERLSPFAQQKIASLKERIDSEQQEIDAIRRASSSGDPTERALFAIQLGQVLEDQLQAKQLLIQAEQIEKPKVLTFARGVKTTARSRRNSVVVAAFIGLIVGLGAALAWEPLARRRK
jgi:uncharacterized protein involved in exopolysaccharide biosynthesis